MSKRRSARKELAELTLKLQDLEVNNKWPNGYVKPGISGDPTLLEQTLNEPIVRRFASPDEGNPLFNVRPSTTVAQLKNMINLAAARQILYLDIEMQKQKIANLGSDKLLDATLAEMKTCVQQRFRAYEEEGFEVPTGWDSIESYTEQLKEFLETRYKQYLVDNADTLIDKQKSEVKQNSRE